MAKKKESEEAASRLLTKTLPGIQPQISGEGDFSIDGTNTGWQTSQVTIDGVAWNLLFRSESFDLSGYSLQDKTLFAQGVLVQHCPTIVGNAGFFTSNIVSTEPLRITDFEITTDGGTWALPGNMNSGFSMQQILYGDCTLYVEDTTVNTCRAVTSSQWGTGSSTARDKLYCAVAIAMSPAPSVGTQQILYPDTTFVIPSIIAKEPELEYMMRLSRSVESP